MTETTNATSERRRVALERYLRELAGLMGLADWTIAVSPEPAKDDDDEAETYITVTVDVGRRATVRAHGRVGRATVRAAPAAPAGLRG